MTFAVVTRTDRESLDRLTDNDVRAIEIGYQILMEPTEAEVESLGESLIQRGIQIWSVHAPFGNKNNLSALDATERREALDIQKRLLPRAVLAGVQVVVIHPGVGIKPEDHAASAEALRQSLPELTAAAESAGVRLGLENMLPGHLGDEPQELLEFVEAIDSPALGICFDAGHAHCNHDVCGAFEVLQEKVITFHLQDNDGTRDLHLQPGYGTIPWSELVPAIEAMAFTDPLVIEAWPWDGVAFRTMLEEMDLLFDRAGQLRPLRLADRLRRAAVAG